MNVTIRKAEPDDAEAACVVLRRSIEECCGEDHLFDPILLGGWLRNKTVGNLRAWFVSCGHAVVAEHASMVVGVAMLGGNGRITLCYLLPEVRRQGIGRRLLDALEAEAQSRGIALLGLESTKTARTFYRRNGYRETGTVRSEFGLTAHRMEKVLGGPGH